MKLANAVHLWDHVALLHDLHLGAWIFRGSRGGALMLSSNQPSKWFWNGNYIAFEKNMYILIYIYTYRFIYIYIYLYINVMRMKKIRTKLKNLENSFKAKAFQPKDCRARPISWKTPSYPSHGKCHSKHRVDTEQANMLILRVVHLLISLPTGSNILA